ncbi:hypothetical protein ACJMK2_012786 [Sinanodonta woodiana]|uniref:SREBP regulating gene protein n=1 Tax=Sinanodonta woodiana TaxID=1069815 RepID=A0ABD3VAY9_SINWO
MFSIRVLRRRWVLALIFLGSLIYFVYITLSKNKTLLRDEYTIKHSLLRQTFQWQPMVPDVAEGNNTALLQCRNSVQGKTIIVDDRGYVCAREHLAASDCCDIKTPTTSKYNCSTCQQNACCSFYELCVSCCLQPEKKPVLQKILQEARNSYNKLYMSVSDQFELCLVKCRTSSQSVQHENSYRDPKAKYCYGENPPDLQVVVS